MSFGGAGLGGSTLGVVEKAGVTPLNKGLQKTIVAEAVQEVQATLSFQQWAQKIPEPQTGDLDFERFPYLKEIYATAGEASDAVYEKGTQVGLSTLALRWALWVAGERAGTVMYVFPVKDAVYKFSDQRVKPVIRGSDFLRKKMAHDDPDNKGLKKIGSGYVYFVGSQSVSELDSVPANALVLDEFDELAQNNIPVVLRRVGAALKPMIRYIGVPTLDNYGIEAQFKQTQMKRWLVRCSGCNEPQQVKWENVRYEELAPGAFKGWRVCVHCEREIESDLHAGRGEWVAEYKERDRIGYHIPRLIVPNANIGEVVKGRLSDREAEQRAHYNRDLAEPFETAESRLAGAAIDACKREGVHLVESYVGFNWVTMGIDVSTTRGLHVRISEHLNEREKRVLWVGVIDAITTANPEEPDRSALHTLARMMVDYKVNMAMIDHLPDGLFSRAFCAAHPGRAYMVAYNTDYRAKSEIKMPRQGTADLVVSVKRTEWITTTLDLFRRQRNLLPLREPLPKGMEGKTYEEHLRNIVKERKEDNFGREYYGYKETGPEDFLQAEVYDCVATEVMRLRLMERHLSSQLEAETDIVPPNPTPDLAAWDGQPVTAPLEDAQRPYESTYGEGWDDEYRP